MNSNFTAVSNAFAASVGLAGSESMTGPLYLANGTAVAPGLTFGADTNLGLYRVSADVLGITANGAQIGAWDATSLTALGALNLGHASDTTIARVSAGVASIEGSNILLASGLGSITQAYDAELAAIAGLTSAADRVPYFTGSGTAALATFTSFARTLVDDANAATAQGTLGLTIATQAEMETASATDRTVSPGRQHFHPGHPKAGGNFDGTAGTPSFAADYGMGAITDVAVGRWVLAFDTAFSAVSYWHAAMCESTTTTQGRVIGGLSGGTRTTSSLEITCINTSGNNVDSANTGIAFYGDYA